ncbi:MAG TPA: hypothetical protein VEC14_10225 [Reyranellaceae bacterium]|nr:hypothetical protein [Reyranellaceae bacterium]
MPLHHTISHSKRLVVALAKGSCGRADIERYFAEVSTEGGGPYGKIFDVTQGEFTLSKEDVDILAARIGELAKLKLPMGPVAIVASSDESRAIARLFARTAPAERPIAIFSEHHEARKWVEARLDGGA